MLSPTPKIKNKQTNGQLWGLVLPFIYVLRFICVCECACCGYVCHVFAGAHGGRGRPVTLELVAVSLPGWVLGTEPQSSGLPFTFDLGFASHNSTRRNFTVYEGVRLRWGPAGFQTRPFTGKLHSVPTEHFVSSTERECCGPKRSPLGLRCPPKAQALW